MSTQTRILVSIMFLVALAGCATPNAPQATSTPMAAMAESKHPAPTDIVIFIDVLPSGDVTVTPDTAYVDDPAQSLHWISNGPDFDIVFAVPPQAQRPLPPVQYEKGKGRGHLKNIPPVLHKGTHTYSVSIIKPTGEAVRIDPIIIVTY